MAREAYRSLYGDLRKLKDNSLLDDPAAGDGDDDEMFELLLAVSAWVDAYCNRCFYPLTAARRFDGTGGARLPVPDLVSLTGLTHYPDGGEEGEAWAPHDYALEPYNAAPTMPWGSPYASIIALGRAERRAFEAGRRNYEITGVWGYGQLAEPSGASVAAQGGVDAAQTSVAVTDGAHFAPGQTLLVGAEQALVTAVNANTLTLRARAQRHDRRRARARRGYLAAALARAGGAGDAHQRGAHLDARPRIRAVLRGRRPGHGRAAAARPLQEDDDLTMATTTQRERIATLESAIEAHDREHQLLERLWTQRLIAIEERLANIEEALQAWRGAPLPGARLSKRDVGLASGSAALATIGWLLLEQLGALAARGG